MPLHHRHIKDLVLVAIACGFVASSLIAVPAYADDLDAPMAFEANEQQVDSSSEDDGPAVVSEESVDTSEGAIDDSPDDVSGETVVNPESPEAPEQFGAVGGEQDGSTDDVTETDDIPIDAEGETATDPEAVSEVESQEDDSQEEESPDGETVLSGSEETLAAGTGTLDGVDISGHNSLINISNLDADFVIIKATEWNPDKKNYTSYTTGRTNNTYVSYTAQADAALAAGKLIGFYHFATNPSMGASWTAQAQGFIDAVSGYIGNAVLFLDWENASYSTIESNVGGARQWLDYVYEHTGVMPMIYMNKSCSQSYDWSSVESARYELWGAQYADIKHHTGYQSDPWQSNDNWGAWGSRPTLFQYSSTTTVSGSGGEVDVNKFYGSRDDWIALCGAKEMLGADTSTALQDNMVYSFASLPSSTLTIVDKDGNAELGSDSYVNGYWRIANLGGGIYSFANLQNGSLLSFSASPVKGTNVVTNGAISTWRLIKCTNGSFALVPNGYDNLRLDVASGKTTQSGANIQLYNANGSAAQRFFILASVGMNSALSLGQSVTDGYYFITSAKDPSKVIDIKGGSCDNGANVQLYNGNNTFAQDYRLEYQGNGLYVIRNLKSGKVLDVAGGKRVKGTNVQQYGANGTIAQLWYLKESGDGYAICSAASGLVLDLAGGKTANGTNIQVYTPNGTAAQQFVLVADVPLNEALSAHDDGTIVSDGIYSLFSNARDGIVLDISGASTANGGNVQIYASNGSLAQKFEVTYVGNGFYTFQSAVSRKYLDAQGGGRTKGTNVQQYQGNGSRAQLWYFVPSGDGDGYTIKNAASGLALDLASGGTSNGTNVQLWTANGTVAQSFSLEFAPLLEDGVYYIASDLLGSIRLVLDVADGSKSSGANVQGYRLNMAKSQRWSIEYQGDGTYKIVNENSGMALDVSNASTASGANVQQYNPNGTPAQLWRIGMSDFGGITIQNVASGKYLDVAGAKVANGTNIQQYNGNNSRAQSYTVISSEMLDVFISRMIYYCDVASVGYSQGEQRYDLRDGGSCDCSSLIIGCLKEAGFAVGKADSTRDIRKNLTANGWTVVSWNMGSVRPGDILLCDGYHCCVVVSGTGSNATIAEAWLNENGGTHDGRPGDQTGQETRTRKVYQYPYGGGWQCILRYSA